MGTSINNYIDDIKWIKINRTFDIGYVKEIFLSDILFDIEHKVLHRYDNPSINCTYIIVTRKKIL